MSTKLDCVASIVIYKNPPDMIRNAAISFLKTELRVKLYIVDNSPEPLLQSAFSDLPVIYHFTGKNVGYGRGHNWVIQHAKPSRYHVILNPDILILNGAIRKLIQFMETHREVGMVCPKFLNADGSIQYLNKREPNVLDLTIRRFLPVILRPLFRHRLDKYEMKDIGYDKEYDVPFIPGAFMLCRTSVLKSVGGFDPRYFMYFEDADLSREFQKQNSKTVYYPHASVIHQWERAPHKSMKMALVLVTNGIKYFNKWGWKLA